MTTDRQKRTAIRRRNLVALRKEAKVLQWTAVAVVVMIAIGTAISAQYFLGFLGECAAVLSVLAIRWPIRRDIIAAEAALEREQT
jgi:uncharacterized membrane protein YwzB